VIGSSATVAQAVGQPLVDVLQLQTESVRWGHVADELRSFLKGVEGAIGKRAASVPEDFEASWSRKPG
jgi:hypothetical protein